MKLIELIKKFYILIIGIFVVLVYCMFLMYFKNHFFFRTNINGVNVSLMNIEKADKKLQEEIKEYKLQINERDKITEDISGADIKLEYIKNKEVLNKFLNSQEYMFWVKSLFKKTSLTEDNLFKFDDKELDSTIKKLDCLQEKNIVVPQSPKIIYENDEYCVYSEVNGNKLQENKFKEFINKSILDGIKVVNLDQADLYEKPKYKKDSKEVIDAKDKLNKYIKTRIVYDFDINTENLDKDIVKQWLNVDDNMNVVIDKDEILKYIKTLESKYNTTDKERNFKTSVGKEIKIKGGNYGFKINRDKEIEEVINSIENGQQIMRKPYYSQKAMCRNEDDDIGDTYVEVNISKQMLWFYKNGKLITSGDVVTGNINRGNGTHLGIYELNYKQKDATLNGHGYSSKVKYWMPFDGNIGLHDASWRNSFGGNIYKNNGTHGCVNLPIYLAKKIYDEIEEGTPIICYNE